MTTKEIRTDSLRAWLLAARPKTLTGAAVPVMLGCGLAAADGGFVLLPAVLCLAFALMMQIDANLIKRPVGLPERLRRGRPPRA